MSDPIQHPPGIRKWLSLLVLSLAVAIIVIDSTVLNVSIKNIIQDLNTDLKTIQSAITYYSLVIAAFTIFGGRLGDLFGRKKVFIAGAIIFGAGSLINAFSPSVGWLFTGYSIVEALGAALMIPASSSLLVSNYEGRDRATAFGLYGATAGVASAIGPIIGGYLTTNYSWRWAYGINVFVVLALILGSRFVRGYEMPKNKKPALDYLGVILSAVGLSSLTYGFIETSEYGWITAKKPFEIFGGSYDLAGLSISLYAILAGLIITIGFILYERYLENHDHLQPLIAMSIFKNRQFSVAIALVAFVFSGFTGILTFGVILYYQNVLNLGAFDSGLGIIPLSLGILITAPIAARIADRLGAKGTIQLGLVISAVGAVLLYFAMAVGATRVTFIPSLGIFGLGFGFIISQVTNLILSSVPISQAGEASGLNGTLRQVGQAFGTAIIGAVFIATLTNHITDKINNSSVIPDQAKASIVNSFSDGNLDSTPSSANTTPSPITDEITKDLDQSIVEASRDAISFTFGFIAVSFIISLFLPNKKIEQKVEADAEKAEFVPSIAH